MNWLRALFGVEKPIIGMVHFRSLPGDPKYDAASDVQTSAGLLLRDIEALQEGGVDGIMFSNEGSQPWMVNPEPVTAIAMASLIGRVRNSVKVPFGVHVIWSPEATLDLAAATSAAFAWEIFTGVFASDYGLWNTNFGRIARHQSRLHAQTVRLFFEIVPEAAVYLGSRLIVEQVRSTIFNARPDALCVAGLKPGEAVSTAGTALVKEISPNIPVLVSTGVKTSNAARQLAVADGAIIGSAFKKDGYLWNQVDKERVIELMSVVKKLRNSY